MSKHLADEAINKKLKMENEPSVTDTREARPVYRFEDSRLITALRQNHWQYLVMGLVALSFIMVCLVRPEGWMKVVALGIIMLAALLETALDGAEKLLDMDFLADEIIVTLAAFAAFISKNYYAAVLLVIFYRISVLTMDYADRMCAAILDERCDILPDKCCVKTEDGSLQTAPDTVNPGDIVLLNPGDIIPVDGIITEGMTAVDTSSVTGQSASWNVAKGYRVYSGCTNRSAKISVRAIRTSANSTAARLVAMLEKASTKKSEQESRTREMARMYKIAALVSALLIMFVQPLLDKVWRVNAQRAAIILIGALLPTLINLLLKMIYTCALAKAAKGGVFFRSAKGVEKLANADSFILAKTGVMTEGRYTVTDVFPVGMTDKELIELAASAESFSRHPIAVALKEAAGKIDLTEKKVMQIEEIPGRGVSSFIGKKNVYVGNTAFLEEHGIKCAVPTISGAAIHVAMDSRYCGHIIISDKVRRNAFDVLENLRSLGVKKLVLLTSDVLSAAKPLASKLNFDMLRAELTPEEKLAAVSYLMSNKGGNKTIAYVGDGETDGEILRAADVGISLGALSSDAAHSNSDVLIMDREIRRLPDTLKIAKTSRLTAKIAIGITAAAGLLCFILGFFNAVPVIFIAAALFAIEHVMLIFILWKCYR